MNNASSNVVSLFNPKNENSLNSDPTPQEELSFMEVMRRNKTNEDRLKRERAKANKSVIRSYRLKT